MGQADFIIRKKKPSHSTGVNFYKKKGFANASTAIGPRRQQNEMQINQIIKKETLYQGDHDLGNGLYNIEMLLSQNNDLVISAQHFSLPDSFIIEIEAMKVENLINEFDRDFYQMASYLKIMNKRMVLLNPKFINTK